MARLSQDTKDKILDDFHLGKSQNELARLYEVSPATINKICKGIKQKYVDKVNTIVSIKSELSEESEYLVNAFDKEVNRQLMLKQIVFNASEKLLIKATKMIEENKTVDKINVGAGVQQIEPRNLDSSDLKNLADTIDKASITLGVNQRHANSQVNINNTNATQNNIKTLDDFYTEEL